MKKKIEEYNITQDLAKVKRERRTPKASPSYKALKFEETGAIFEREKSFL